MTPNFLSSTWNTIAPALGNHLWQSTLFAIAMWLLTLLWRKNQAQARYWLWMAASLKFLVPFSLLIALGGRMATPRVAPETTNTFFWAMEQVTQPFAHQPSALSSPASVAAISTKRIDLLPILFASAWLCGLVVVFLIWWARWRRISRIVRGAVPLQEGREAQALQRLQYQTGFEPRVSILLSRTLVEPGIFGICHPVLLWPEGISQHLGDEHLEAILRHEIWHVRRRDNLAATIHMLVEALFWFHPLVWWVGARLVEERERACDQEVLALGSQRQVYAESILKTCEFCMEALLPCVSGVAGADLKKRIVNIMNEGVEKKLSLSKKLLLATIGAVVVAGPVIFGLLHAPRVRAQSPQAATTALPSFEVASIKPSRPDDSMVKMLFTRSGLSAENFTVHGFIRTAYNVQENQILGGPGWLNSEKYDVEAKVDSAVAQQHTSPDDRRLALQQLLADRFKLKLHRETRELPVYELVVTRSGPKFREAKPGDTYADGAKRHDGQPIGPGIWLLGRGDLAGQGMPLSALILILSRQLDRPILDKTGLTSNYDYKLQWSPEESHAPSNDQETVSPDSPAPSVFVAIQEQLGLKLEPRKAPVEVLVIDHVERPSEN